MCMGSLPVMSAAWPVQNPQPCSPIQQVPDGILVAKPELAPPHTLMGRHLRTLLDTLTAAEHET